MTKYKLKPSLKIIFKVHTDRFLLPTPIPHPVAIVLIFIIQWNENFRFKHGIIRLLLTGIDYLTKNQK